LFVLTAENDEAEAVAAWNPIYSVPGRTGNLVISTGYKSKIAGRLESFGHHETNAIRFPVAPTVKTTKTVISSSTSRSPENSFSRI
jgi:hypothetical protein